MRRAIINKAMRCIDEVYPGMDVVNAPYFPVGKFLDEAGLRIIKAAPLHALGRGLSFKNTTEGDGPPPRNKVSLTDNGDGSGRIMLPPMFCRLISLRMEGWQRPVTEAIRVDNPLYAKQFNPLTRGGVVKPVAVLTQGDKALDFFSVPQGKPMKIAELRVFIYYGVRNNYPSKLADAAAWQLAALILGTMEDTKAAETAQQRAIEMVRLLD